MQQVNTTCTKGKQDRQNTSLPLPTHTPLHIHTHNPHAYTRQYFSFPNSLKNHFQCAMHPAACRQLLLLMTLFSLFLENICLVLLHMCVHVWAREKARQFPCTCASLAFARPITQWVVTHCGQSINSAIIYSRSFWPSYMSYMTNPHQSFVLIRKRQKSLLWHPGFARGVCWLLLLPTCSLMLWFKWPLTITLKKVGGGNCIPHSR